MDLPAAKQYLGYGVDLSTANGLNMSSALKSILTMDRFVSIDNATSPQDVYGTKYNIPNNVDIQVSPHLEAEGRTFQSGSDVTHEMEVDAKVSGHFGGFTGSADVSHSTKKHFKEDSSYAFYDHNQSIYTASLKDWTASIRSSIFTSRSADLGPFNYQDLKSIDRYKAFFADIGTHCIVKVHYGARLMLSLWSSNSSSEQKSKWDAHVKAEYDGLFNASGEASYKQTDEYKEYKSSVQRNCYCSGGDVTKAMAVQANPNVADLFSAWAATTTTNPSVTAFTVKPIWQLMHNVDNADVRALSDDVKRAYYWLLDHPGEHHTICSFDIRSNFGELRLLTPGATIQPDPHLAPPEGTEITPHSIKWGVELGNSINILTDFMNPNSNYSRVFKLLQSKNLVVPIPFIIVNDGSPVKFQLNQETWYKGDSGKIEANVLKVHKKSYVSTWMMDALSGILGGISIVPPKWETHEIPVNPEHYIPPGGL